MDVPVLVAPSAAGAAESGSFLRPRCPSVRSQCFTFGAALCISVLALSVIDVPPALKVRQAGPTLPPSDIFYYSKDVFFLLITSPHVVSTQVTSAHATLPWAARAPYRWVLRQV